MRIPLFLETDRLRLDAEEGADERRQACHRAARLTAPNRDERLSLLGCRALVGDEGDRSSCLLSILSGACPTMTKLRSSRDNVPCRPRSTLEDEGEVAVTFGAGNGQLLVTHGHEDSRSCTIRSNHR